MTTTNWYAIEMLVDERRRELERDARRVAGRRVSPAHRRTLRFLHRH